MYLFIFNVFIFFLDISATEKLQNKYKNSHSLHPNPTHANTLQLLYLVLYKDTRLLYPRFFSYSVYVYLQRFSEPYGVTIKHNILSAIQNTCPKNIFLKSKYNYQNQKTNTDTTLLSKYRPYSDFASCSNNVLCNKRKSQNIHCTSLWHL